MTSGEVISAWATPLQRNMQRWRAVSDNVRFDRPGNGNPDPGPDLRAG